jgi:hypothetical protein
MLEAVIVGLIVVVVLQVRALQQSTRVLRKVLFMEERMSRFSELLCLLTEACHAGFNSMGDEITRIADRPQAPPRPPVSGLRLKRAAGRGESITQIAAAEQLAEGEVGLRLFLEEAKGARRSKRKTNGSLRAS